MQCIFLGTSIVRYAIHVRFDDFAPLNDTLQKAYVVRRILEEIYSSKGDCTPEVKKAVPTYLNMAAIKSGLLHVTNVLQATISLMGLNLIRSIALLVR